MWLKNFCGHNIFAPFCLTIFLIFELRLFLFLPFPHLLHSFYQSPFIFFIQFVFVCPFFFFCCHLTAKLSSQRCLARPSAWANICAAYHAQELINFAILNCSFDCSSSPPSHPLLLPVVFTQKKMKKKQSKRVDWRRKKRLNNNIVASFSILLGKQKCLRSCNILRVEERNV